MGNISTIEKITAEIQKFNDDIPIIIYCRTRNDCEKVSIELTDKILNVHFIMPV
jgi:superfamily II DNA helicase RecQ